MIGIKLITAERKRQIEVEKWTAKHDEQHEDGELSLVAALYATPCDLFTIKLSKSGVSWVDPWPWHDMIDPPRGGPLMKVPAWDKRKKHSRLRRLVIAGALIAAEIDRLSV